MHDKTNSNVQKESTIRQSAFLVFFILQQQQENKDNFYRHNNNKTQRHIHPYGFIKKRSQPWQINYG